MKLSWEYWLYPKRTFILSVFITIICFGIYLFSFRSLEEFTIGPNYWILLNVYSKTALYFTLLFNILTAIIWIIDIKFPQKTNTEIRKAICELVLLVLGIFAIVNGIVSGYFSYLLNYVLHRLL